MILQLRTIDNRIPRTAVIEQEMNVPGDVTAKPIAINNPLIGLLAKTALNIINFVLFRNRDVVRKRLISFFYSLDQIRVIRRPMIAKKTKKMNFFQPENPLKRKNRQHKRAMCVPTIKQKIYGINKSIVLS